jgi:hypothetical protein
VQHQDALEAKGENPNWRGTEYHSMKWRKYAGCFLTQMSYGEPE